MNKKDRIINDIRGLLDELAALEDGGSGATAAKGNKNSQSASAAKTKYEGCMGGILYLLDNGFFNAPKSSKEVAEELKKEGWHYGSSLISMNLLSLTRQRKLTRLEGGKNKEWLYVIRK